MRAATMTQMLIEGGMEVSVCVGCARHASLKRVIEADSTIGICGFCGETEVTVRNPANSEPMVMLFRALIRLHWDEIEYNPHFGGDSVLHLFANDNNPVVEPAITDEYWDELDYLLQEPPYPAEDEGISIYAGFNGGFRLMNHAISGSLPRCISDLRRRLDASNFAAFETELDALFAPFVD